MQIKTTWLNNFFLVADLFATFSKDPSTKVGAVIIDDKMRVVSTGFNGFPRLVDDAQVRYEDRELKLLMTLHAEQNAILSATQDLTEKCIIITHPPCARCTAQIIQCPITDIRCKKAENFDRWKKDMELSQQMITEAGISYQEY